MGPANKIEPVLLEEGRNNYSSKDVADSSFGFAPHFDSRVGISPKQVTQNTSVWDIGWPQNIIDLVDIGQIWGKATVHAEYFLLDDCSYRHAVETVDKALPEFDIVSTFT